MLYKDKDVTLFLYGYLKNDQADISQNEEKQLRLFASELMRLSSAERARLKTQGKLIAIEL